MEIHLTTTEYHLPYGITQCYLSPDTSEHTPPLPQPDRLVLGLPTIKQERKQLRSKNALRPQNSLAPKMWLGACL